MSSEGDQILIRHGQLNVECDAVGDLVIVTPPSSEPGDVDMWGSYSPRFRQRGLRKFQSHCDTLSSDAKSTFTRKSVSMPNSQSTGSLQLTNGDTDVAEKPLLHIPKSLFKSTSSTHQRDPHRQYEEKRRSRTPQPVRKILARTRSSSPHSPKHMSLPRDCKNDVEMDSPWTKTKKFLSRKTPNSAFQLNASKNNKEPSPTGNQSKGITEVGECVEAPVSSTVTDLVQSDGHKAEVANQSIGPSGIASDMPGDVPDGAAPLTNTSQREHLRQKIMKTSEQIKIEQAARDENVAEYLRLSQSADKQQTNRMKSVFEKKNQKSKAVVAQLQKKLDGYHRRLREVDSNGKTIGGKLGLKEKLNDFSGGVASSVQGITNMLKTTNKKFPSVDNISALKDEYQGDEDIERSNSIDNVSATTSESGEHSNAEYHQSQPNSITSLPPRPSSPQPQFALLKQEIATLHIQMDKLTELQAQQDRIRDELDLFKDAMMQKIGDLTENLERYDYRYTDLSGQLQDLSDLHRREMDDVKQDLVSLEERLEYHAQERARDIQEALESCQTRISKMEVQQQQQHQQLVTMEGVENATAKALVGKLINLLLSVLAVILVFVSTACSIVMPFVRNQTRVVVTGVSLLLVAVLYRHWVPLTGILKDSWWWR